MKNFVVQLLILFGNVIMFLFGNFDVYLKILMVLLVIDYITGICKSFVNKNINSSIGATGIIKKVGYLCVVVVSVFIDQILNCGGKLRQIVIMTFIFNESISILENSSEMGVKIPSILSTSLEKINGKEDNNSH